MGKQTHSGHSAGAMRTVRLNVYAKLQRQIGRNGLRRFSEAQPLAKRTSDFAFAGVAWGKANRRRRKLSLALADLTIAPPDNRVDSNKHAGVANRVPVL